MISFETHLFTFLTYIENIHNQFIHIFVKKIKKTHVWFVN